MQHFHERPDDRILYEICKWHQAGKEGKVRTQRNLAKLEIYYGNKMKQNTFQQGQVWGVQTEE